MIQQNLGGSGGEEDSAPQEPEPVSDTDQAVQEAETLFEEFQKGIESGETCKKD